MFSQKVEYALRAVVHLCMSAGAADGGADRGGDTGAAGLPGEGGAGTGPRGSAALAAGHRRRDLAVKAPSELTLLEVVNAVEPIGASRSVRWGWRHMGAFAPAARASTTPWPRSRTLSAARPWPKSWPSPARAFPCATFRAPAT